MKKIGFIVLLFLSLWGMQAQIMKIGVKAGLNYANLSGSDLQTDAITSYHAGLLINLKLSEKLSVQPEIMYSTQGASYKNLTEEVKAQLGYVAMPVLAKIGLGKSLSIELGPQFSWLASENVDFTTDVKTLDFSAAGGLGLKLTDKLFLQGRYVLGLTELSKSANVKNSVGQLSLGYMF